MEKYQNCWEYWHCPPEMQKECSVFKARDGKNCWIYTDNLKVFDWAQGKRGFKSCADCPWYKHLNTH